MVSLERQEIYAFTGAGSDFEVFKPNFPGTSTIYPHPLLYGTPSIDLALFFALVKNNPVVSASPTMKTITCEHRVSQTQPELNIYVGADQETLDTVNVPGNSGWVAVFVPGSLDAIHMGVSQMQAIQRYTSFGRMGEFATEMPTVPHQLIKVTNDDFPIPIGEIPLYSPPPEWSSQQRRNHEPYMTEGFPCFNAWKQPFAKVFPVPTYML